MGILYNAVECEEGTVTGGDGIIITYNKETSTRRGITSLGGRKDSLQSFGILSEPKVVGPDRAQSVAQGRLDLSAILSVVSYRTLRRVLTLLPRKALRRNVPRANILNA